MIAWLTGKGGLLPCPPAREDHTLTHIASPGKDPNAKFEIQFLPNCCMGDREVEKLLS